VDSFRHAFAGCWHVLRTQQNAWIHTAFSVGVVGVGLWLKLSTVEWAIIALTMGLVWTAELINTALEAIIDLASPDIDPLAKTGKDVAAAAVLVSAGTSVIVGILILGPPLYERLRLLLGWPVR
jgi:diacylglycerol kinase (ATP)